METIALISSPQLECPGCLSRNCKIFLKEGSLDIWRCRDCRLAFIWPPPKSSEHESKFKYSYIDNENRVLTRFTQHRQKALDAIAKIVDASAAGGRLLDVGTAGGSFLLRFSQDPKWQVEGVEPSQVAAGYGSNRFGLLIHQGYVREMDFPDNTFDVVTCLDTLCFVLKPLDELKEIKRILKPKGKLFIEVPNLDYRFLKDCGPLGYLLNGRWVNLYQGAHISFYNQRSLTKLLTNSGFETKSIHEIPGPKLGRQAHDMLLSLYQTGSKLLFKVTSNRINLLPKFLVMSQKPG